MIYSAAIGASPEKSKRGNPAVYMEVYLPIVTIGTWSSGIGYGSTQVCKGRPVQAQNRYGHSKGCLKVFSLIFIA